MVTALGTAGLGTIAVVAPSRWAAALAGVGAIAVAVQSFDRRPPVAPPIDPPPPPAPRADAIGVTEAEVAGEVREVAPSLDTEPPRILDEVTLTRALFSRVAMARRALRPLSLIHLEVVAGDGRRVEIAQRFEQMLDVTLRESDVCGRRADGVYVFILEDTGEDGAVWTAERLRRNMAASTEGIRLCAGIASYPSHGLVAAALDAKAASALDVARQWHRDRIEVAEGP